jgi:hypothetical protein
VAEKRVMEAKALKVVGRWVNQCVARTIDAWHEHTVEEARKRGLMRRIVARMLYRSLSFALDLWQQNIFEARKLRTEEERRQNIMSRIVMKLNQRLVCNTLQAWQQLDASKRDRDDHAKSVKRLEAMLRSLNAQVDDLQNKMLITCLQRVPSHMCEFDPAGLGAREMHLDARHLVSPSFVFGHTKPLLPFSYFLEEQAARHPDSQSAPHIPQDALIDEARARIAPLTTGLEQRIEVWWSAASASVSAVVASTIFAVDTAAASTAPVKAHSFTQQIVDTSSLAAPAGEEGGRGMKDSNVVGGGWAGKGGWGGFQTAVPDVKSENTDCDTDRSLGFGLFDIFDVAEQRRKERAAATGVVRLSLSLSLSQSLSLSLSCVCICMRTLSLSLSLSLSLTQHYEKPDPRTAWRASAMLGGAGRVTNASGVGRAGGGGGGDDGRARLASAAAEKAIVLTNRLVDGPVGPLCLPQTESGQSKSSQQVLLISPKRHSSAKECDRIQRGATNDLEGGSRSSNPSSLLRAPSRRELQPIRWVPTKATPND